MRTFTFQNDPERCSSRCSCYVWRVLHVTEEGPVVTKLSRTQLYRDVPLVYVSNKLHSVFELNWSWGFFPIGKVENLPKEKEIEIKLHTYYSVDTSVDSSRYSIACSSINKRTEW